jgi:hypothetical protein
LRVASFSLRPASTLLPKITPSASSCLPFNARFTASHPDSCHICCARRRESLRYTRFSSRTVAHLAEARCATPGSTPRMRGIAFQSQVVHRSPHDLLSLETARDKITARVRKGPDMPGRQDSSQDARRATLTFVCAPKVRVGFRSLKELPPSLRLTLHDSTVTHLSKGDPCGI